MKSRREKRTVWIVPEEYKIFTALELGAPNVKVGKQIGEFIKANNLKPQSKILFIKGGLADSSTVLTVLPDFWRALA